MEPMASRLMTIVYDPAGNVSGRTENLKDQVAQEGSSPIVTYTYDRNGGTLEIAKSDKSAPSNEIEE